MSPSAPRIAVLAIGDELLSGEVLDTNLRSIADSLACLGLVVARHVTIPDEIEQISNEVRDLSRGNDAVIVTGGLGPTSDDLTTEAVALAAGKDLVFHPHLEENLLRFFAALGRPMSEENLKQAYLPDGAVEIAAGGTAPGFMIDIEGALVAVLPGVPREMESMLASAVIPEIENRFPRSAVTATRRLMTFGMGESDVANLVSDRIDAGVVKYGFLVRNGPIVVKLTVSGDDESAVQGLLDEEEREARKKLGDLVYAVDDTTMEAVVGDLLRERGMTIATAESLTAGMITARMANTPGSSDYLLGGVVAYSTEGKNQILDVPEGLLEPGAVSRQVAEAMAVGARKLFGSDLAISSTGVAGPGSGGEVKPRGTVAIALAHEGGEISLERRLPGGRDMVRAIATMAALNMVRLHLLRADGRVASH